MERDFGQEIARSFGLRLKRVYKIEETTLPPQMTAWLERLKNAEHELALSTEVQATEVQPRG